MGQSSPQYCRSCSFDEGSLLLWIKHVRLPLRGCKENIVLIRVSFLSSVAVTKLFSLHPMGPIPSVSIRSVGLGPRINEISRDDRQMSRDKDYLRVPA